MYPLTPSLCSGLLNVTYSEISLSIPPEIAFFLICLLLYCIFLHSIWYHIIYLFTCSFVGWLNEWMYLPFLRTLTLVLVSLRVKSAHPSQERVWGWVQGKPRFPIWLFKETPGVLLHRLRGPPTPEAACSRDFASVKTSLPAFFLPAWLGYPPT